MRLLFFGEAHKTSGFHMFLLPFNEKNKQGFRLAFLKSLTCTNSTHCSGSRNKISLPAFLLFNWKIFSSVCTCHRRLSVCRNMLRDEGNWKDFQNQYLISKKQTGTLHLLFLLGATEKIKKTSAIIQKVLQRFLRPPRKILIS